MSRPKERLEPDRALPMRWTNGAWVRDDPGRPPEALRSGASNDPLPAPTRPRGRLARLYGRLVPRSVPDDAEEQFLLACFLDGMSKEEARSRWKDRHS